jgi:hypothetical protein
MPNIIKPLDDSLAYMYCPICRQQGTVNSHLRREMQTVRCQFGHSWDTTSFRQLLSQHPDMTPMSELCIEQPSPNTSPWKIFVTPETRQAFETKFAGRVFVTMGTFIAALCSDEIIFVDGEIAGKLKAKGLGSGASIWAAIESAATLESERDQAIKRLEQLMALLRQSGVTE